MARYKRSLGNKGRRLPRWLRTARASVRRDERRPSGVAGRSSSSSWAASPGAGAFRRRVAVVIAVVSIAGVLAAWQASVAAGQASGQQQQGLQHLVHKEQEENKNAGLADQDERLAGLYRQHLAAWRAFHRQAAQMQGQAPRLAGYLHTQAREHHAMARSMRHFFLTYEPPEPALAPTVPSAPPGGSAAYFEDELKELRPDQIFHQASQTSTRATVFEGLTAVFAVALFLLTLAELARSGLRQYFALSGGAVSAVGLIAFVGVVAWSP
jgi:hypothetical protein